MISSNLPSLSDLRSSVNGLPGDRFERFLRRLEWIRKTLIELLEQARRRILHERSQIAELDAVATQGCAHGILRKRAVWRPDR